ncbi:unnamed protein product [Rotaria sordida]|uniref:Uncharacterized protein n=1 Tax=Rotaria sordida TaxID=392033 RepID=A0A815BCH4_9BILA|nr:unnamed protein product [Rotaria sordida]CAF1271776.1 unnamed protein product [Rotaria sordida]CAF1546421.1 unnamed protein product [Rotaria sordida]CAF1551323.1 unnamed protein product [Rotaria sordida]
MMELCSYLSQTHRFQSTSSAIFRSHLTNNEIRAYLLRIFAKEYPIESRKLLMNKNLSTSYHCARRLSSVLVDQFCLALITDEHL